MTNYRYYGGPYDRGSNDKYYRLPKNPHKYVYPGNERVELTDPDEIAAYNKGYDEETNEKDYS